MPVEIRNTQPHASTVENSTAPSTVESQLQSFQNPQILWTISSGHDVIHTSASFPVKGFIITNGDCHILSARV